MTLQDALTESSATILRRDAETLLAHLLQRDHAFLIAHADDSLADSILSDLRTLTTRRAATEPLQYILGEQDFYGLTLRVTPAALLPRPETELLVEAVLDWITDRISDPILPHPHLLSPRILDVGTGTGAIALALAHHLPTAHVTATDISPAALALARENAATHHLTGRIRFLLSDLLQSEELHPPFDIIVSNPPYVASTDASTLQPEVVLHEPHTALFAGPSGLDIYRRLIPQAHAALAPGGLLALEHGYTQREDLRTLLETQPTATAPATTQPATTAPPWHDLRFLDDYAGIPRIALATRP